IRRDRAGGHVEGPECRDRRPSGAGTVLRQPLSNTELPASRPGAFILSARTVPLRLRVGLALTLVLVSGPVWANAAGDNSYLKELTRQAREARLSEERYWHLLLHYRRDLTGGYTSEVDDPGFFLAPNGKADPQAELEATLAKFFSDELVGRSSQPTQCAFVARYHWLKSRLAVDDRR